MYLVLELQREIIENKMSTQDILRKAYLISKKLNIDNINKWLNFEMNGYKSEEDLPEYRKLQGTLERLNIYHGWQPLFFKNQKSKDAYSSLFILDSINQIESTIQITDGNTIYYSGPKFDPLIHGFNTKVRSFVSKTYLENILGIVKNNILEWTLNLEKNGILGENMAFTKEEKNNASNITYNIYGDNARVNNNSTDNSTNIVYNNPEVIKQLDSLRDEINKLESNSKESLEIINTIEEQLKLKQPNKTIIKRECWSLFQVLCKC